MPADKSVKEITALLPYNHTVIRQVKDLAASMQTKLIFVPPQNYEFVLPIKESTDLMFCLYSFERSSK